MIKDIGLFMSPPNQIVGCKKVAESLVRGLNTLGVNVHKNKSMPVTGCIQFLPALKGNNLPKNTLVGPEIMVLPNEMKWMWEKWKYWAQPSQWVCDYMYEFPEIKKNDVTLSVWPVGIDTERFNVERGDFQYDCFVYYKDVTKQTTDKDLNIIGQELNRRGMKYLVMKYGKYTEDQLMAYCKSCRFAIFITGTESQGIALMEVLSCGVPVLLLEIDCFLYGSYTFRGQNVSAAPYFDHRCGMKLKKYDWHLMDHFLDNLKWYNPREYILDNHTIKKGAKKYLNILERVNS